MALVLAIDVPGSYAQYGGYNQGYGGNNQGYGGYNQGYGGYNGGYGGGMGGGMGGMGSRMGGMGGRMCGLSGRGGLSGRSSRGGGGYGAGAYGGYNQGYQSQGSSRRGRSNYSTSNYGGLVPQGGQEGQNQGQTAPQGGMSTDRRRALTGKTSRGAMGSTAPPNAPGGGITVQPGQGGIAVPQPGAPPQQVAPGGKGRQAQRKPEPQIKLRSKATLLVSTRSPVAVVQQPFTVNISLANPSRLEFDTLAFAIQYDPADLMPIADSDDEGNWISLTELPTEEHPQVEDASKESGKNASSSTAKESLYLLARKNSHFKVISNDVDKEKGLIRFECSQEGDPNKDSGVIATLQFVPLREQENASIHFLFDEKTGEEATADALPMTRLTLKDGDQLGAKTEARDGVVDLNVQVYGTREKAERRAIVKKAGDRDELKPDEAAASTHLYLMPHKKEVDVGDILDVDVYLANPDGEQIDSVNLLIAFNPRVFQAEDADDVATGVNLSDRDYKEEFPFDFPVLNAIDNEKGLIDYRVQGLRKVIRNEGIFATFRLRALRPTSKTTFRVLLNESGQSPTTGIFFRTRDRLGDPTIYTDGVTTTSISIRPTTAYLRKLGLSG